MLEDDNDSFTSKSTPDLQSRTYASKARSQSKRHVKVMPGAAEYPIKCYDNFESQDPIVDETRALHEIKKEWCRDPGNTSREIICSLENFSIYNLTTHKWHPSLLTSLDSLSQKASLMFSGTLCIGNIRQVVEDAPFDVLSIQGYGVEHDGAVTVFIKSAAAQIFKTMDVWYRLGTPSVEYRPHFDSFLWVAQFGKYVVDYLDDQSSNTVNLGHFRTSFEGWLTAHFSITAVLQKWRKAFGISDYRQSFNAYNHWLYFQAYDTEDQTVQQRRISHPVWSDCGWGESSEIETLPMKCDKTIATPFVYRAFKEMYFEKCLQEVPISPSVKGAHTSRLLKFGFLTLGRITHGNAPQDARDTRDTNPSRNEPDQSRIHLNTKVGDVITVPGDGDRHVWGKSSIYHAYVQGLKRKGDHHELSVIWMYTPAETLIGNCFYPYKNELFLSDHCNCHEPKLLSTEVLAVHTVDWFPRTLQKRRDFIVRQKYLADGSGFVKAKETDKVCQCHDEMKPYPSGTTVYVSRGSKSDLEPVIVEGHDMATQTVKVRELIRVARLDGQSKDRIPPNELAWTDNIFSVPARNIIGKCHIRVFPMRESEDRSALPFPYNQQGRWHYWFIASNLNKTTNYLEPLTTLPFFHQGLDPHVVSKKPMKALSLFSGGGGLDRGLEAAGGVKFHTTIDMDPSALLTQKANATDKKRYLCASVDDVLLKLLDGDGSIKIGDVEFLCAGSPCQGCSRLQLDRYSTKSLRNVSHITTWLSYIDFFRPEYGILENVTTVCDNMANNSSNIIGQIIATLVGMGYQTQAFIENAWNHGSSQRRSRLFVAIAAPGLVPISPPQPTHGDVITLRENGRYAGPVIRSLGKLPCGVRFGNRDVTIQTPFKCLTTEDAIGDLPNIGTSTQRICVRYPDHRVAALLGEKQRQIIRHIPTSPPGCSYKKALAQGLIPKRLQQDRSDSGHAYTRIHPHGLIPTITTVLSARCSRTGTVIHPTQHRQISVQETRRAQNWPDAEVVIGDSVEQSKTIGNGVDRHPATALGFGFRYVWEASGNTGDSQRKNALGISDLRLEYDVPEDDAQATLLDIALSPIEDQHNGISSESTPMTGDMEDTIVVTPRRASHVLVAPRRSLHNNAIERNDSDTEENSQSTPIEATMEDTIVVTPRRLPYVVPKFYDSDTGETYQFNGDGSRIYDSIRTSPKRPAQQISVSPPKPPIDSSDTDNSSQNEQLMQKPQKRRVDADSDDDSDERVLRWPRKRTRNTGHIVEYVPKNWSKTLERQLNRSRKIAEKGARGNVNGDQQSRVA